MGENGQGKQLSFLSLLVVAIELLLAFKCLSSLFVTHFLLFVQASHFFWGLWALIQAKFSTIDFDFLGYVTNFSKWSDFFLLVPFTNCMLKLCTVSHWVENGEV